MRSRKWLFLPPLAMLVAGSLLALAMPAAGRAEPAEATPSPSPTRPPWANVKLHCGGNWHHDYVPNPAIQAPTDLVGALDLTGDEVQLTWRDNAGNETCYGVVGRGVETERPMIITPANGQQAELPLLIEAGRDGSRLEPAFAAGEWCFTVFAANADGLSTSSNEVCLQIPELSLAGSLPRTGGEGPVANGDGPDERSLAFIWVGGLFLLAVAALLRRLAVQR